MESILFHLVALLLVQFMVISTAKVVTNITTDQYALLDFKAHITSDILAQYWSSSTPMCQWVGISCSARHGRVTALNLSNMTLQGTISPHLGNLSFLISLNISINNFHGPLPKELGKLPRLKRIIVNNNSFSGIIHHSLFNMSKLEIMDLSYNLIEGGIPFERGQLPSLKVLSVEGNKLSGSLPDDMYKSLPRLEKFSFANNTFVGSIPSSIGNLTKLKELYLSFNYLRGDILQELGNLIELEIVDMRNMGVGGPIPFFIFNTSSLRKTNLFRNHLVGSLPVDICHHIPLLQSLYLGDNKLTGGIPKSIENCTLLEKLRVDHNYLKEYGSEGIISTRCDVYAFGILLMEIFTRMKPTDEMFVGELNLKSWVKESLVHALTKVVDSNLLKREDKHFVAKLNCLSSVMELALACIEDSPEDRIIVSDALVMLKKIKNKMLKDIGAKCNTRSRMRRQS
ncbi:putative receptor-like protein kinase At3g47110 [Tripterygium wilfordii]|uniref:putative receptor-like protein kinase At3g47110 n=1 Tax=Tripterygium wilfordii TaxID=458696 RepID=UPI0018F82A54|nr:putative receptor-like protein kinase At3g47110 [Tripterygium wilfordii]